MQVVTSTYGTEEQETNAQTRTEATTTRPVRESNPRKQKNGQALSMDCRRALLALLYKMRVYRLSELQREAKGGV